jgi:hypothetical protein
MQDFEKLGVFYLGRPYDVAAGKPRDGLVLYDSKDLVTHAVCVGMTGSGKTGLCISILEEAAIDSIPSIVIDPKGDLANLLLTFPKLEPADFRPWIDEDEARRAGVTPDQFAAQQSDQWKKGLAQWGESGERVQRLRDAADFAIYTPGSSAGIPVSILKSFAAPPAEVLADEEVLQARVASTATSLLGLLGIDADPIQSRDHILISTILATAWKSARDLDLSALIGEIQKPPVARVGVIDLESFYPAKERFALAMRLNNLLASPGFASWLEGEPLDVGAALHTPAGKPRVSIFSIAHLADAERMFFVSLLLNQVLGWMRAQSGTSSLRAIVYMDEIFGYFPPVASPPSKQPLLTLLKQARAFGVGVVLATQNPVDLDYKGLANAGTWFVGRLQTERDKARLLDGLEGAAAQAGAGFDKAKMAAILSSLGKRIFLMNNVHEAQPTVFESRWTLSYLRGPLSRPQIKSLMDARTAGAAPSATAKSAPAPATAAPVNPALPRSPSSSGPSPRPVLPPDVRQCFVPLRTSAPAGASLLYRASLVACAKVFFEDAKSGASTELAVAALVAMDGGAVVVDWDKAQAVDLCETDLESEPARDASYGALAPEAGKAKSYDAWKKGAADYLYRSQTLAIFRSSSTKAFSKPGESERDFRVRLQHDAREERDRQTEKLRARYAPKHAALEDKIRRADAARAKEAEQASQSKIQTAISFGTTLLAAFTGRKTLSAATIGRATTAARGIGRAMKDSADVTRAEGDVEASKRELADLDAQFQSELAALEAKLDPSTETLETITLRPRKSNIDVRFVALCWTPAWRSSDGSSTPAWG